MYSNKIETQDTHADLECAFNQLDAMKLTEEAYRCCDYSNDVKCDADDGVNVNEDCRNKMVQWCYQVVEFYGIDREIVVATFSYIDRYIGGLRDRSNILSCRKRYQLLVMTSLYVATKVFETKVIELSLLVKLSRGTYLKEDFENMERNLLFNLKWRLHPPTSTSFARQYLMIASMKDMDEALTSACFAFVCTQIEKSLHQYELALYRPSTVAACGILNALEHLDPQSSTDKFISRIEEISTICNVDLDMKDVEEVRRILCNIVFPTEIFSLNAPSTTENHSRNRFVGNIRYSPICVGRQSQTVVE